MRYEIDNCGDSWKINFEGCENLTDPELIVFLQCLLRDVQDLDKGEREDIAQCLEKHKNCFDRFGVRSRFAKFLEILRH